MRVSEVYASTQGEGPNVGRTTIFTRFGGCNLRCPGWPCDTQHAIDPAYRKEWLSQTPVLVAERIMQMAKISGAEFVTLTGGEPFLQPNNELEELVQILKINGFKIDCFSNGTLPYPQWAVCAIQFIMDWKLPGSGEDPYNTTRLANLKLLQASPLSQSVKFVIKDYSDYATAIELWKQYIKKENKFNITPYYGRVWDCDITNAELIAQVMLDKLPWLLNVQVHNMIWPPTERGR